MSSSPSISRPRPVSTLNRPTRRSTGSAPQEIQRSLSAAIRKISTVSMPAMDMLVDSPTNASKSATLPNAMVAANGQGGSPGFSTGGLIPTPAPKVQTAPTTPLSPLSPVFSAISAEPLQPQQLRSSTSTPPARDTSTPTNTPTPSLSGNDDVGDKYAILADLDSAFGDPAKAPSTTINWAGTHPSEEEAGEASGSAESPAGGHPKQNRSGSFHRSSSGGSAPAPAGGIVPNGGTASQEPVQPQQYPAGASQPPSPLSSGSPPTHTSTLINNGDVGDKYAALADLDSAFSSDPAKLQATTINWGTSQSTEESRATSDSAESQAGSHPTQDRSGAVNRNIPGGSRSATVGGGMLNGGAGLSGSPPGVVSSSPPSRSMMAAQVQMYGTPAQPVVYGAQVTMNNHGYCIPATMYNAPATPHPGFAPTAVNSNMGYVYPQHPAQPGSPFSTVVQGHPAYPGMVPQGYPAQGAGWGQVGYAVPHTKPSSSSPVLMRSQLPSQVPVCLS